MGIHLNSKGGLTVSQRIHADKLGISHEVFKKYLLVRLDELNKPLPKTVRSHKMQRDEITTQNPVLIMAAGPSFRKNIEEIRKFKGKTIVVDVIFNELLKNNIVPDYVLTLESNTSIVNESLFESSHLAKCKDKTMIVGSAITEDKILNHIRSHGVAIQRWDFEEEPRASNVGVFALNFAKDHLRADKILLVGFEHIGKKYAGNTYKTWQVDFWHFIKDWPRETIVNCSNGGALYYEDYIIDANLEKLKVNPT